MKQYRVDKIALLLAVLMMTFMFPAAVEAATPQFTVEAAHYTAIDAYKQDWVCDADTDLDDGVNCYSDGGAVPTSYSWAYQPIYFDTGGSGLDWWYTHGIARNNGWFTANNPDTPHTWEAGGPQGQQVTLREVAWKFQTSYADKHYILRSVLSRTGVFGRSTYYAIGTFFNGGEFVGNEDSGIVFHTSISGSFPRGPSGEQELMRFHRPTGQGSGAQYHINKGEFVEHPTNSDLWIGTTNAVYAAAQERVVTPIIVNHATRTFSLQYQNEGWCEYDWGMVFDGFNTNVKCAQSNDPASPYYGTVPDYLEGAGEPWSTLGQGMALVDGQVLLLRYQTTARACGTNETCQLERAKICDVSLWHGSLTSTDYRYLYVERSANQICSNSYLCENPGGKQWLVRAASLSNWNTSQTGWTWSGNDTVIRDGTQAAQFRIEPTDNRLWGLFGATLKQMENGSVYLYLQTKRAWCEPEGSSAPWDRWPALSSGSSFIWFRLSY